MLGQAAKRIEHNPQVAEFEPERVDHGRRQIHHYGGFAEAIRHLHEFSGSHSAHFELGGQPVAALQQVEGRFILSLNDVPEVRALFAWASIETVEVSYQAGGAGNTKRARELLIEGNCRKI
ncbi:hypothetical protein LJR090_001804 [Bosea sp. LjRoot90]|uniref:hypothetical protein n=1 Tax=Bosea sp. LjRoot90 TaxID=3342342 RepID=UPI003ED0DC1E